MKNSGLSQKIKELRSGKGISQDELATSAQLSLRTVQRVESGQNQPRGDTLKRLAEALHISPEELTGHAVKEDKAYLVVMNLSGLCILLSPLFGIIAPLALWILKRDKIENVDRTGRKMINFELSWLLIILLSPIYLSIANKFHFQLLPWWFSLFGLSGMELLIMMWYFYNIALVILNSLLSLRDKELFYQPAIPFLKEKSS